MSCNLEEDCECNKRGCQGCINSSTKDIIIKLLNNMEIISKQIRTLVEEERG